MSKLGEVNDNTLSQILCSHYTYFLRIYNMGKCLCQSNSFKKGHILIIHLILIILKNILKYRKYRSKKSVESNI